MRSTVQLSGDLKGLLREREPGNSLFAKRDPHLHQAAAGREIFALPFLHRRVLRAQGRDFNTGWKFARAMSSVNGG